MTENIVIIGAGGQGIEVAFFLSRIIKGTTSFSLYGFVDDNKNLHGKEINGIPVLGGIDYLKEIKDKEISCILALGYPDVKKKIESKIAEYKLPYANIIDPSAIIDYETTKIGKGVIIAPGVVILPNTEIEDHVLVNYNSVIGHNSKIGKFSTISPNVGIAGDVIINEGVFVGIGASVIQNLTIGKWSTIGAGAAVISDIPENVVAVGIPAKSIKDS